MRLEILRTMSEKEIRESPEYKQTLERIRLAGKWLDENGTWTPRTSKELKKAGEPLILWEAKK